MCVIQSWEMRDKCMFLKNYFHSTKTTWLHWQISWLRISMKQNSWLELSLTHRNLLSKRLMLCMTWVSRLSSFHPRNWKITGKRSLALRVRSVPMDLRIGYEFRYQRSMAGSLELETWQLPFSWHGFTEQTMILPLPVPKPCHLSNVFLIEHSSLPKRVDKDSMLEHLNLSWFKARRTSRILQISFGQTVSFKFNQWSMLTNGNDLVTSKQQARLIQTSSFINRAQK